MNTFRGLGLVCALLVATSPAVAIAGPLTDSCAAEAASKYEPGYEDIGKLQYEMDTGAAMAACLNAIQVEPSRAVEAWLGRAMRASGLSEAALAQSRAAAAEGNLLAMQTVGDMMSDGIGGSDPADGFALLEKAAALGFAPAVNSLGFSYSNGRGVAPDEVKGLALYREAAELGYGLGAANVGLFYQQGKGGLEIDLEEAVEWFRRGADLGDPMGMFLLGNAYYYGAGVPQDFAVALPLYERSAAQNYPDSIGALGHAYHFGDGVAQDYRRAFESYTRAYDLGVHWAASYLGGLHLGPFDSDVAEARRWIDLGLLRDHPYAMYLMGRIYADGLGVVPDADLARTWYDKALGAGLAEAEALAQAQPAD